MKRLSQKRQFRAARRLCRAVSPNALPFSDEEQLALGRLLSELYYL